MLPWSDVFRIEWRNNSHQELPVGIKRRLLVNGPEVVPVLLTRLVYPKWESQVPEVRTYTWKTEEGRRQKKKNSAIQKDEKLTSSQGENMVSRRIPLRFGITDIFSKNLSLWLPVQHVRPEYSRIRPHERTQVHPEYSGIRPHERTHARPEYSGILSHQRIHARPNIPGSVHMNELMRDRNIPRSVHMNEHTRARNIPESVNINEYTRARIFQDPFTWTNKHAPGIFRDPDEKG